MRVLFTLGSIGDLTDGQLLERFATGRDEASELAFTALVERHGPMVLRVCRSVLADPPDAEDAFQAAFLVLVKKARGLWVADSIGPWLHQVAFRTASCARKNAIRRQRHERRAAERRRVETQAEDGARAEMEKLLHAEIDRLPDRYRLPIVLCDLEGRSHEEAARHLGWPVGTVKSRLSRGRDRLRDRLCREGRTLGAEFLAVAFRPDFMSHRVPAVLIESTTTAAVQFAASQTIASASAAALAQGVLSAMVMTRWIKAASVLIVAGATVSGAGFMSRMAASGVKPGEQKTAEPRPGAAVPVAKAERGTFKVTVSGRGAIEAARRTNLLSLVKDQTTILSIVPEGTRVKKGDLVCELDPAPSWDRLTKQRIAARGADVPYRNAKRSRENAELALKEYQEGIYPLDQSRIQGEIKLADSAIQQAKAQRERTRRYRERIKAERRDGAAGGSGDLLAELSLENQLDAVEQDLLREQLALEQAQAKLRVLEQYTKPKTIQELNLRIAERRSVELIQEHAYQLVKDHERNLERQIENCKLIAPRQGIVVYTRNHFQFGEPSPIEVGATVREGQIIMWIEDVNSPMLVNAKIPESMVHREEVGQKADVMIDAFRDRKFSGEVVDIAPLPDPTSFLSRDAKVYTTHIRITDPPPELRPGMTATVEILLAKHDNALTVPASAVIQVEDKCRVAVKKDDGGFTWRDVTLGDASGSAFEIKEGIKLGEEVATEPRKLLSEQDQAKATSPIAAPNKKAKGDRPRGKTVGGNVSPALLQKLRNLGAEDRAKLKTAAPEERQAILKKAGLTDEEVRELDARATRLRDTNRPE